MTAKEYLSQSRIAQNSLEVKRERIEALTARATKMTQTLSGMPSGGGASKEDAYAAMIDAKDELVRDVIRLVQKESEIYRTIQRVPDKEAQILLERRYICSQTWEDIADSMGYDVRTIYRLHGKALAQIKSIIDEHASECQ